MKPRPFFSHVLLPAFIPLFVMALGRTYLPMLSSKWFAAGLMLASAALYLKRLSDYWGFSEEIKPELRRFKWLVLLILPLLPLNLFFLLSISISPARGALTWIFLITGSASFFILLSLLLEFSRLSAELSAKRVRLVVGLIIGIASVFTDLDNRIQFLIFFLLAVWIFNFEAIATLRIRQKVGLTIFCLIGLILLGGIAFNGYGFVVSGSRANALLSESVRVLETSLLPFLKDFIGGLKRLSLALFIVFPGKIILRPAADWLKVSLRIRTKLALSYLFSSIIPVLLLLVILSFGVMFMLGGFMQLFVDEMLQSRIGALQSVWESTTAAFEHKSFASQAAKERELCAYFEANQISVVLAKIAAENRLEDVRRYGATLPRAVATEGTPGDTNAAKTSTSNDRLTLPVQNSAGVQLSQFKNADSLLIPLSQDNFAGLSWFGDSLYLNQWRRDGDTIVGLFKPFTQTDLNEMHARSNSDLMLYRASDIQLGESTTGRGEVQIEKSSTSGIVVSMENDIKPVLEAKGPPKGGGFLNQNLSFPVLLKSLSWDPQTGLEERFSVMIVKPTSYALFAMAFSPKHYVNRIYLAIFAVVAAFFGVILVLVALLGFGLAAGITRTIRQLRKGTQQLRKGDLTVNIQVKTRDELGELAQSFNLMVADLNRMLEEVKEKERLEGELEAARAIQLKLLPDKVPQMSGFDIVASSLPAKQVGGDYYDFFALPDNQLGLAVGDVSGKGMPAALLMANLQASLRALIKSDLPLEQLVERLNSALHSNTAPQMFATFFLGSLDVESGSLHYVNAGHNYPLLCGNGRLERLSEGGLLLGVMPDGTYQAGRVTIQRGKLVALYSDGITEATDREGREFGEERLIQLLKNSRQHTADNILNAVLRDVEGFSGTPEDDVTLVVVKRV